ncbi:hypothetical protein ACC715_36775, partial [Rhizobium ruizarguesonis]
AAAPALFDGSLTLHLSGCAKGCAHSRPALTLTGSAEGYVLILNGLAADQPDERIAGGRIDRDGHCSFTVAIDRDKPICVGLSSDTNIGGD